MILSAGKFFKNLFQRKQRVQVKETIPEEKKSYGLLDSFNGAIRGKNHSTSISAHNMEQSGKAQRRLKTRKANKLARKQRKLNAKKGYKS